MFKASLKLALAAALIAPPALADSPIKTVELSGRLFEIGTELRDPTLVLAAAKLRRSVPLEQVDRAPTDGDTSGSEDIFSWQSMTDVATELAADDDAMLGLIEDFKAENDKGVASGQVYSNSPHPERWHRHLCRHHLHRWRLRRGLCGRQIQRRPERASA